MVQAFDDPYRVSQVAFHNRKRVVAIFYLVKYDIHENLTITELLVIIFSFSVLSNMLLDRIECKVQTHFMGRADRDFVRAEGF